MWGKIKSAFGILFRGMFASFYGFAGAVLTAISVWLCVGLFTGAANIRSYVRNRRTLRESDAKIAALAKELAKTNMHIKLLQDHSPDFVSEMALQKLNLGDSETMILKK
ncbi:MAG: hypothetical protein LBB08_00370 [Rickettsiales bacterium]|jgi:cell division protein FtsB|nr:hypothetical protein [Rickettsiales bacterium]